MTKFTYLNRRYFMATTAATSFLFGANHAAAAGPIKVAAIYTVPVEQQWVSRIHKAAQTAQNAVISHIRSPRMSAIQTMPV